MKRLIMLRHGKSSWEYDVQDDKRPLKKRGFKDGNLVAGAFNKFNDQPLVIWSSPAVRAHETAKIFKKTLRIPDKDFHVHASLYTFNSLDLLQQIKSCDDDIETLIVVGHNPATTNLVNELGNRYFENIPTTGLTVLDFKSKKWANLGTGETILHLFPKNLR